MIRRAGVMCPGEKSDFMPDSMMDGLSLGELGPTTFICGARAISMGGERNRTSLQSIFQIQIKMEKMASAAKMAPAAIFARSI